ncbi:hypothetical protein LXA43DRAFT_1059765 [Ganoderma leucocontextum]|nr:hypothetical protein LXA43DRAFT_1059765 [Ganoderma leucocontextum]
MPVKAFSPGTCYVLLNARGGTAMDLSGADNTSIIGYPMHGGANQQWDFIPCGLGYAIRCVRPSKDGNALYLTVDCGGVRDRAPIVAGVYPVAWTVEQTEQGIIISWPNSKYVFDLANWGDKAACTKIQLMPLIPGELCQLWHLDARGPAPDAYDATAAAVSSTCSFTPGTYHVLLNAHCGTAMDMSGTDDTSITGYPMHGGDNQQWEFIRCGLGHAIRCVRPSQDGNACYLTVESGGAGDCAPVVASAHPVAWNVEQTEEGTRISWPNSQYVFHLANEGDQAACKKLQLMPLIPGELCQLWRTTQVTTACK